MNILRKLVFYMTGRKLLLPFALLFSALSSIATLVPFIFIWLIARECLNPNISHSLIKSYAIWAVAISIAGILIYFLSLTLSHLAAFRVETNMRKKAMSKLLDMPLGFFDNNTSGRIRKIIDDNASITHSFLAHQLPDLAGTIITPLATIGLLFFFDYRMGLACLLPLIFSLTILRLMIGSRGQEFMNNYMNALESMNTEAVEYVRGIPVVKTFQQTIFSFKNFHNSIIRYKKMVMSYTNLWEKPMSGYIVIINSFAFILVPLTIILLNYSTNLTQTILNLFFYVLITPVFGHCIMRSMYLSQAIGHAAQAIDRLEDLSKTPPLKALDIPIKIKSYNINFQDVSFSYPDSKHETLRNISFTIPEGKTYALVGPSGSGKTTIARLIARFWDPQNGTISIGNNDVTEISNNDLMNNITFVFQNSKLFKGSILANIKYGKPEASMQDIQRAIDLAQCRNIIEKLPDGLDTIIGPHGTYLSGGEQQRIALARAFLKNAPIVILDEATAFSDPENEDLIQKSLQRLLRGKTVLLIAHRLSSVKNADNIFVIKDGKIAEQGSHDMLLLKEGLYHSMWNTYQQSIEWTIGKEAQYA
ncbi:ABC transporter ATP-binding protein [Puteibacter caeruleilacunae]|nr:ABC transporter ATP-binding protein [Puteibacter caeruleilacunae]